MTQSAQAPACTHLIDLAAERLDRIVRMVSVLTGFLLGVSAMGQGDLEYLRKNTYLETYYAHPFNCDSLTDDQVNTMTDRICANLHLQRSDSLLKEVHGLLVVEVRSLGGDSLVRSFDDLQRAWRVFRDAHCKAQIGEITGNGSAAGYMDEMRMLTEVRIEELERLLELYRSGPR